MFELKTNPNSINYIQNVCQKGSRIVNCRIATEKYDVNRFIDCKKSIIVYIKHRELCMK